MRTYFRLKLLYGSLKEHDVRTLVLSTYSDNDSDFKRLQHQLIKGTLKSETNQIHHKLMFHVPAHQ